MKHRTLGKTARWLRRHVPALGDYKDSVRVAIDHFRACGVEGARRLRGSKLTREFTP